MAGKKKKFTDITQAEIAEWKKTKGSLRQVSIPTDDDVARFVICKPSKDLLPAITQYGKEENFDAANNLLVTNCVLGGDMDYLDSDVDVYLAVVGEVGKLMQAKLVTSTKL